MKITKLLWKQGNCHDIEGMVEAAQIDTEIRPAPHDLSFEFGRII